MSTSEDMGRSSYLDLLVAVLSQHEKNMDKIIEKMEKLLKDLGTTDRGERTSDKNSVTIKEAELSSTSSDTLTYMKIKLNRPLDEVLTILKSLKE